MSNFGVDYDRFSALYFQFPEQGGSLSAENILHALFVSLCPEHMSSEMRWRLLGWTEMLISKPPPEVLSLLPRWTPFLISGLGSAYQTELCHGDDEQLRLDISKLVLQTMK